MSACVHCGATLPVQTGSGRRRMFCDATCRMAYHKARGTWPTRPRKVRDPLANVHHRNARIRTPLDFVADERMVLWTCRTCGGENVHRTCKAYIYRPCVHCGTPHGFRIREKNLPVEYHGRGYTVDPRPVGEQQERLEWTCPKCGTRQESSNRGRADYACASCHALTNVKVPPLLWPV